MASDPNDASGPSAEKESAPWGNPVSGASPDEPLPASVPERIGPYRLKRVIASGGMGTVYLAQQEQPRRTVALKVMRSGVVSRSAARRFEYEAQVLARLTHPNIAQVYDAGTHDDGGGGVPYFAMEYVPNARSLTEHCRERQLTVRARLDLFAKVCDAIHHGHQRGIIHRDLKPGNILVDSTGAPKIIDFGVARATDSDMAVTTLQTDVGQLIGTLQYMSPEQCDADPHDLDTRSDVYALGVVLYELLCDRPPYDLVDVILPRAVELIRDAAPTRPSAIDRTLRGDVETIVLKALEKDRNRRYQSAMQFADDVRRYLAGDAIEGRPPSLLYQLQVMARRHRAAFVASVAVVVVLAAATAVSTVFGVRMKVAQERAAADRDRAVAAREHADLLRSQVEEQFDTLHGLTRSFVLDLDPMIEREGLSRAREQIVDDVEPALDDLLAARPDDAELRADVAAMYRRIGEIRGGERGASLGDTDLALANYQKSRAIYDELAAARPGDPAIQVQRSRVYISLGDAFRRTKRTKESLEHYETALAIRERLYEADPSDVERQRDLAVALLAVGDALDRIGETERAIEFSRRSLEMREGLLADGAPDLSGRRALTSAMLRVADRLQKDGQLDAATVLFARVVEIRDELARPVPASRRARRDAAVARYYLGYALLDGPDEAGAIDQFETFRASAEALYLEDPGDQRAHRDLSLAYDALADGYAASGDRERLLALRRRYAAVARQVYEADPANTLNGHQLGNALQKLAETVAPDDRPGAIAMCREAVAILTPLVEADPADRRLGEDYAVVRETLARLEAPETE